LLLTCVLANRSATTSAHRSCNAESWSACCCSA